MIKQDEFDRVCRLAGLMQGKGFWTTSDKKYGVEIKGDKVVSFALNGFERDYSPVIDESRIMSVIGAFEKDARSIEPGLMDMARINNISQEEKTEEKQIVTQQEPGIMPDTLTDALYQKWQNLSIPQRLLMLQNTAKTHIEKRKGKGGTFAYVDINYMLRCANMAFGFAWDSKVTSWKETDKEVICFGTVEALINDRRIIKSAVGQKDIAFKKDSKEVLCLGDDYKSAESDMIKKALSQFGIASDVYGGEV